jgi:hypothetical protein
MAGSKHLWDITNFYEITWCNILEDIFKSSVIPSFDDYCTIYLLYLHLSTHIKRDMDLNPELTISCTMGKETLNILIIQQQSFIYTGEHYTI